MVSPLYSCVIKHATPRVLPIFFISLNIFDFGKYGILVPLFDILSAYNLYIFSIFFDGLNLINGIDFSAWIVLNIISSGIV